jgi:hypothetical protein
MPVRPWRGWWVFGLTLVLSAAGVALTLACGPIEVPSGADDPLSLAAASAAIAVPFGAVGALLVVRRPENAIGLLFCVVGLLFAAGSLANGWCAYAVYGGGLPAAGLAAWVASCVVTIPLFTGPLFLLLLFPAGRLLSPRWRPVALAVGAFGLAGLVVDTLQPGPFDGWPTLANPLGTSGATGRLMVQLQGLAGIPFVALFLVAAACLVLRRRRAGELERQQIKWVVYAACLTASAFVISISSPEPIDYWVFWIGMAGLAGMPVAAGLAILRYRLYEIDRVINRTLVYGLLTACLVAVYAGGVLVLQELLSPITSGSHLAVAVSTLVVAAIFGPARSGIQRWVDRRFYRRRYDATRTLEAFSAHLRDEVDLDALAQQLHAAVSETMQPERVTLWLRPAPGQLGAKPGSLLPSGGRAIESPSP